MSNLDRYQCDCCGNAYNGMPEDTHGIDGDVYDMCSECKREFDRVTDFPEDAFGMDYQYHGIYFPKSVDGESVRRHFWMIQEDYNGLAEWVLLDKLLMAFHSDYIARIDDEYDESNDGYREYRKRAEQEVWDDEEFNRS